MGDYVISGRKFQETRRIQNLLLRNLQARWLILKDLHSMISKVYVATSDWVEKELHPNLQGVDEVILRVTTTVEVIDAAKEDGNG